MGIMNENMSQQIAVLQYIAPDAYAAGSVTTSAIDMSTVERILVLVQTGDMVSTATLDMRAQTAPATTGTWANLSSASITTMDQTAAGSNKTAQLEILSSAMPNTDRYLRGILTLTTAGADCGVVILGMGAKYAPASDYDLGSGSEGQVVQKVVVTGA